MRARALDQLVRRGNAEAADRGGGHAPDLPGARAGAGAECAAGNIETNEIGLHGRAAHAIASPFPCSQHCRASRWPRLDRQRRARRRALRPIPAAECQTFATQVQRRDRALPPRPSEDDFTDLTDRSEGRSCHISASASDQAYAAPKRSDSEARRCYSPVGRTIRRAPTSGPAEAREGLCQRQPHRHGRSELGARPGRQLLRQAAALGLQYPAAAEAVERHRRHRREGGEVALSPELIDLNQGARLANTRTVPRP